MESYRLRRIPYTLFALEPVASMFGPWVHFPLQPLFWPIFAISLTLAVKIHRRYPKKHDRPEDFDRLYTDGAYEFCRHPFYLCTMISSISFSIATGSVMAILISIAVVLTLLLVIEVEERELESYWGEEWRRYAERTPKIIPTRIYTVLIKLFR